MDSHGLQGRAIGTIAAVAGRIVGVSVGAEAAALCVRTNLNGPLTLRPPTQSGKQRGGAQQ